MTKRRALLMRRYGHASYWNAGFDESKVNRDGDGKFAPKGVSDAGKPDDTEADPFKPQMAPADILDAVRRGEDVTQRPFDVYAAIIDEFADTGTFPLSADEYEALTASMATTDPARGLQSVFDALTMAMDGEGRFASVYERMGAETIGHLRLSLQEVISRADPTGVWGELAHDLMQDGTSVRELRQHQRDLMALNERIGDGFARAPTAEFHRKHTNGDPDILGKVVRTASRMADAIEVLRDRGFQMPTVSVGGYALSNAASIRVNVGSSFQSTMAYYSPSMKTVQFNPIAPRFSNRRADEPIGNGEGTHVGKNDVELLIHELAHAYHHRTGKMNDGMAAIEFMTVDSDTFGLIERGISKYANENNAEFVAEYFTAVVTDHPPLLALSEEDRAKLDSLYRQMGGPDPAPYREMMQR